MYKKNILKTRKMYQMQNGINLIAEYICKYFMINKREATDASLLSGNLLYGDCFTY